MQTIIEKPTTESSIVLKYKKLQLNILTGEAQYNDTKAKFVIGSRPALDGTFCWGGKSLEFEQLISVP